MLGRPLSLPPPGALDVVLRPKCQSDITMSISLRAPVCRAPVAVASSTRSQQPIGACVCRSSRRRVHAAKTRMRRRLALEEEARQATFQAISGADDMRGRLSVRLETLRGHPGRPRRSTPSIGRHVQPRRFLTRNPSTRGPLGASRGSQRGSMRCGGLADSPPNPIRGESGESVRLRLNPVIQSETLGRNRGSPCTNTGCKRGGGYENVAWPCETCTTIEARLTRARGRTHSQGLRAHSPAPPCALPAYASPPLSPSPPPLPPSPRISTVPPSSTLPRPPQSSSTPRTPSARYEPGLTRWNRSQAREDTALTFPRGCALAGPVQQELLP